MPQDPVRPNKQHRSHPTEPAGFRVIALVVVAAVLSLIDACVADRVDRFSEIEQPGQQLLALQIHLFGSKWVSL